MSSVLVQDPDLTIHVGDVRQVLATLPDESVDCVATSPPFYALRDYGVEGQIGLEETPEKWAAELVGVFRARMAAERCSQLSLLAEASA